MHLLDEDDSKIVRINSVFGKKIDELWLQSTLETKKSISAGDVVNACLYKFLEHITIDDIREYRKEIRNKDD